MRVYVGVVKMQHCYIYINLLPWGIAAGRSVRIWISIIYFACILCLHCDISIHGKVGNSIVLRFK